jgi:hypothetical protein
MIPAPVQAAVVTFELDHVTFGDGGTATGSFVFNSTSLALSMVSITTSPNVVPVNFGATYTSGIFTTKSIGIGILDSFQFNVTGYHLELNVAMPLSLTSPNSIFTNFGTSFEENTLEDAFRFVASGSLAPVVPLPAALPLFATGLGVLGLLGWRRKKKTAPLAA